MADHAIYFGKVPFHGDFLNLARPAPAARVLDGFFQDGMLHARERGGDWQAAFDGAGPSRFVLWDRHLPGPFVGMVWPSRDRTGRRYPFVVGLQLPDRPTSAASPAIPLALDQYLMAVEFAAADDWSDATLDVLRQRAEGLVWNGFAADPAHELAQGLARAPAAALWRDLPGFASPPRRSLMLDDVRGMMRARTTPRFVVRIPCPGDVVTIGFWLSLLMHWAPADRQPRLAVWTPPHAAGPHVLRVVLDDLIGRYFVPLWWPVGEHALGFDVAYDRIAPERARTSHAEFGPVVERSATLGALLHALP